MCDSGSLTQAALSVDLNDIPGWEPGMLVDLISEDGVWENDSRRFADEAHYSSERGEAIGWWAERYVVWGEVFDSIIGGKKTVAIGATGDEVGWVLAHGNVVDTCPPEDCSGPKCEFDPGATPEGTAQPEAVETEIPMRGDR